MAEMNIPAPENLDAALESATAPLPTAVPQAAPSPMHAGLPAQVNMINPRGEVVSIPGHQLPDAINEGYTEATPDQVNAHFQEAKYGTLGQQAITAAEGAGSAATFGLSTGVERALGVNPEDIVARRETNPGAHALGQVAGLVGSSLLIPGGGAAGAMELAGTKGAEALGMAAGETALSKIGSGAVRAAIENATFQGGDEVSKLISQDPTQTMATAAANVGLAGLLGGGIGGAVGAVNPLWHATVGPKVEAILDVMSRKAGGIEGATKSALDDAIEASGVQVAPEVRAALSDDVQLNQMAKTLEQSDTTGGGLSYQESLKGFKDQADHALVGSVGKTMDEVPVELSNYEHGKNLGDTLAKEYDTQLSPLSKRYDQLTERFKELSLDAANADTRPAVEKELNREIANLGRARRATERAINGSDPELAVQAAAQLDEIRSKITNLRSQLSAPGTTDKIVQELTELANRQGWTKMPDGIEMLEVNRIIKHMPLQKSLHDLTQYIKNIPFKPTEPSFNRAMQMVKSVLRDHEANVIEKGLQKKMGVQSVMEYNTVRKAYKVQSELKDALDERLHLGGSTAGYGKALKEAAQTDGESVLRRLSGKGDADLLNLLQDQFPETAKALKNYHVESLLHTAGSKAKAGELLNSTAFLNHVNKMSPELKSFALDAKAQAKIGAVEKLLDKLKMQPHNFSNTARTLDRLFEYMPASGAGMALMFAGHNPIIGGVLGYMAKYLGKDVPDALRLATLKFMGSSKPISAPAFKALVDTLDHVVKGEAAMNKGVKNLFKAGRDVLPQSFQVKDRDRKKLVGYLTEAQIHPERLAQSGNALGHYMPDHAGATAQITTNAVNFLNAQRPSSFQAAPLDSKLPPSPAQQAHFNRMLDLANAPLSILNGVKAGRITTEEVLGLHAMYPGLHERLMQKMSTEMTDHLARGGTIPYQTRLGMSMFMGMPLDSTMTPQAILANQPKPQMMPEQGSGKPPSASSMKGLSKLPGSYMTPGQARIQEQSQGK